VDLLDLVIVLLLVGAFFSGWRRGVTWVGLSFLGLLVGLVIGAAIAPGIAHSLGGHTPNTEALIGTGVLLSSVALVQGVGTAVGYRVRVAALRTQFAQLDSVLGSALAALGVLVGAWYLGLTFAQSPFTRLDKQISGSAILRALDDIAPRPPAFLGSLENLLRASEFPNPFAGLAPQTLPQVDLPADVDTPGIRHASVSVSKVVSRACNGFEAGSAWPLGGDLLVTNAHVVAGGSDVTVQAPQHQPLAATVVLFDPDVDVAVLHVPGIGLDALPMATSDPAPRTTGAVIGYPLGRDESVVPAAVRGTEQAQGRDIYGSGLVRRDIVVLTARIVPGNSGGPVVDRNGVVVGLVFAASTLDDTEGYALALSQIRADLDSARGRSQPVSTQDCTD